MPEPLAERVAGRLGVVQLITLECVILAVALATYLYGSTETAVTASAAAIVLFLVVAPLGRRWTYEGIAARVMLGRRRRNTSSAAFDAVAGEVGHRNAALAALAPGLNIATTRDRGNSIGIGRDQLGWFAALVLSPRDDLSGAEIGGIRLDLLAALVADESVPVSSFQLLTQQTVLPGPAADPSTPVVRSYRSLAGTLGVPAQRDVWIALRLAPTDAANATANRGGGVAGVHRALLSVLGRVGSALYAGKVKHQVLDAAGLRRALDTVCVPETTGLSPTELTVRESWDRWQTDAAVHVSFAVEYKSRGGSGEPLTEWAFVPGAIAVTTALVIRRQRIGRTGSGDVLIRTVIRVSAPENAINDCLKRLKDTADELGIRLVRLNGEQAAAVYATAPTGAPIGLLPW